jgi:hypothetical protein
MLYSSGTFIWNWNVPPDQNPSSIGKQSKMKYVWIIFRQSLSDNTSVYKWRKIHLAPLRKGREGYAPPPTSPTSRLHMTWIPGLIVKSNSFKISGSLKSTWQVSNKDREVYKLKLFWSIITSCFDVLLYFIIFVFLFNTLTKHKPGKFSIISGTSEIKNSNNG